MRTISFVILALCLGCDSSVVPFECEGGGSPGDFFRDDDGDGFGRDDRVKPACEAPSGFVAETGDCEDGDATSFPGAAERCDGVDNDCNGTIDDAVAEPDAWYADLDGDGYGDPAVSLRQCGVPEGYVADATDCDDSDGEIHPGAAEYCDDVDQDCDGAPDDNDAVDAPEWHPDGDGDGYGDALTAITACVSPGWLVDAQDCDDTEADIHPGVDETCDELDRDCDGDAYAGAVDGAVWYDDTDGDGYGGVGTTIACELPVGYAALGGDCDDFAAAKHPGAPEYCDTVDHDCDGETYDAESVDALTFYADADEDGFGDAAAPETACRPRRGTVANAADCDDTDAATAPDAPDSCDGVDHDCDGTVDEDDSVDAAFYYTDADGDGFGDAAAGVTSCGSAPAGTVADACDCDDADAAHNPDGLDCDVVACPSGGEVWLDDSCGLREVSASYAGVPGAPATLNLDEPATVTLCDGTHYLLVATTDDLVLASVNGAAVTTLDADGNPGVLAAGNLEVSGLTVANAAATSGGAAIDAAGDLWLEDCVVENGELSGNTGAIVAIGGDATLVGSEVGANSVGYVAATSTTCSLSILAVAGSLTLDDTRVHDNTLTCEGGGAADATTVLAGSTVWVQGDLVATASSILDNQAYGYSDGMASSLAAAGAWVQGDATFSASEVLRNSAEAALDCAWTTCERNTSGGGLRVGGDLSMVDTLVAGNAAIGSGADGAGTPILGAFGGGVYLDSGSLACASSGGDHGFTGNTADSGGAVYWAAAASGATLSSSDCDWGEASDNTPDDVAGSASWSGGDDQTVSCDAVGVCL